MMQLIHNIVERFGGREAGSTQELGAQQYLKEYLESFCNQTRIQEFEIHPKAKFESLKIFCSLYYISLIVFIYNDVAALVLATINTVLFLGHFVTYQNWLDFLFPKGKSLNVEGTIEPVEEAKSTIIVSGHIDSAREFIWWWRLKQTGIVLSILSGILITFLPLYFLMSVLIKSLGNGELTTAIGLFWWLFVILTPITIVMFNIHGKDVVPGAQDNLSGIAVATAVGQYFAKKRLKHTRIKVVSFGSEEIGLRGAEAYANEFNQELKTEKAICLNIDGIKDNNQLRIITSEPMVLAKYPDYLIKGLQKSFDAEHVKYKKSPIPAGATDGVSMIRAGIPAVTIIGLSTEKLDPTYHTRLDVPSCIEPKALENLRDVLINFINNWDVETK